MSPCWGAEAASPNFIQEQLSLTYVRAVTFRTGLRLSRPEGDHHGIDGTILDPDRRGVNRVDFQLKATTVYQIRDDTIVYDLRVEDYNRLVIEDDVPRVLILFILPDDYAEWLVQNEDELCLRKCAYWISLMGQPRSQKTASVRVFVPLANMFNYDGLQDIFGQLL